MERQEERRWLPTTRKEVEAKGWTSLDVVLFSGDAYVDHPSFGTAVIGRVLEAMGLKVAIVPQPNWQDDLRDFKKMGRPNLFFGISPGCMDSMVNHYTAARRRRSDDAYTPGNRAGARPDMPTIVYTRILKELYPDVPVVLGGIEASLRRFTHYDYWLDALRPPILVDSGADLLIYGMGEKPVEELCRMLKRGVPFRNLTNIPQTCVLRPKGEAYATNKKWATITLASHEECLADKRKYAVNFRHIEEESNSLHAAKLLQEVGDRVLVVNPPYPPLDTKELDRVYALPFTRMPHPRYKGKEIPAYNMIRHSVTTHRGCFGGCAFCTISAHQGKFIASRSPESILRAFVDSGWTYAVDFRHLAGLSRRYGTSCTGAADYGAKHIYVSEAKATVHEFGHFLDSILGFPSERSSFYEAEADAASAFLRAYAGTSCREYFADYFANYIANHSNAEKAAQMERLTPETFAFFSALEAGGWQLQSRPHNR